MGEICKVDDEAEQSIIPREIKKAALVIWRNFTKKIKIKLVTNYWALKSKLKVKL